MFGAEIGVFVAIVVIFILLLVGFIFDPTDMRSMTDEDWDEFNKAEADRRAAQSADYQKQLKKARNRAKINAVSSNPLTEKDNGTIH